MTQLARDWIAWLLWFASFVLLVRLRKHLHRLGDDL